MKPLENVSDLDLASALVKLVHLELESYGTDGHTRIDNDEMLLALRAARLVCNRLGVKFPNLPFRDYDSFYKYWKRNGMTGSWAARRDYLQSAFDEVENELFLLEERQFTEVLARPVTTHGSLGWSELDSEIEQVRRRFASAKTEQDYNAVGAGCVRVLETLGDIVYAAEKHSVDQVPLPRDKTKLRIESFIASTLGESDSVEIKKMARATVELAQKVKHSKTATRRDAGIAADSVILLANLLRRITVKD